MQTMIKIKRFMPYILLVVLAVVSLYSFYHRGVKTPFRSAFNIKETDRRGGDFWGTFPAVFVDKYNPSLRDKTIVKDWSKDREWDYGPVQHLVTLPLTFIKSIRTVSILWLLANYLFLILAVWITLKVFSAAPAMLKSVIVFLWLAYWPLYPALEENVIEVFELFMIVLSLYLLRKDRDVLSGAALGVACMAKFLPVIFLGYFLIKGKIRAFFSMLAVIVLIIVMTQVTLGWQNNRMIKNFYAELKEGKFEYTYWRSQTIPSAIERLFSAKDYSANKIYYPTVMKPHIVKWAVKAVVGFIALITFTLLYRNRKRGDIRLEYGIVAAVMFLISTHGEHYYLIFGLIGYSGALYYIYGKKDYFLEVIFGMSYILSGYIMQIREFDRILLPDNTGINREVFFNFLSFPTYGAVLLLFLLLHIYRKADHPEQLSV